jgi:EAL domain-containing protein (putative c-di-GMP-specific phosphodiesterase class I)/ActR/RegA family two-component response regulator
MTTSRRPSTQPRVLLVDDEPAVLSGLRRQLHADYDIRIATSAAVGLELIATDGPFDVVVCDMRMPDMDGAAFLARVRSIARDTIRILLTGQADIDTAMAAVNEGQIFRFLAKPCPVQTLRECLTDAVYQHHRTKAEHQIIDQWLLPRQAAPGTSPEAAAELTAALQAGQFQVWYQPVVDLSTGQITSTEALIRWQHPQRGLLLPAQFLPDAERAGLIIPIGRWVLQQACHDAVAWPPGHVGSLPVAVNLHPDQLRDPGLTDDIRRALAASGLPPARLTLEVTEAVLIDDPRAAAGILGRLRDIGINIAVDDFGTGYSSLSYLQNLPVSILKIDKAFISSLSDTTSVTLTQTIVQLANALGLKTIAEGIETTAQLQICRQLGCNHGQGFLFAEPMRASGLTRILSTQDTTEPAAPVDLTAAGRTQRHRLSDYRVLPGDTDARCMSGLRGCNKTARLAKSHVPGIPS